MSPATGSQTQATMPRSAWTVVDPQTIPKDDGGNLQYIVTQFNAVKAQNPGAAVAIYQRTGTNTATVSNGPSGMPTSTSSSATTEYYLSNCAPGSSGNCQVYGTQSIGQDTTAATQNGVKVTENSVQAGTVNLKSSWVEAQSGINTPLQYVQIGKLINTDANYTVAAADGGNWTKLPNGLFFNPQGVGTMKEGYFFNGAATPTTDMTSLKSNQVTATYSGAFNGTELTDTARRELNGQANLSANFGAGTVTGNVSNLQAYSNCSSQCTTTGAGYNLNVNGTISGNQYSGTAQYATATSAPVTGPATGLTGSGNLVGGFFGGNAAETAAAVRVNGAAPGGATNTTVIGAFGAKKQ